MRVRGLYTKVSLIVILFLSSCSQAKDIYKLPVFSAKGNVNAVIEIPAGTNIKLEYYVEDKQFSPDQRNGKDRVIEFLPYPANYGFIPSTLSDSSDGGDGDALDILVLCAALETGTVLEVIPIGMLNLIDAGEIDSKIIAIPADQDLQTISAMSLEELRERYPRVEEIIKMWFLNYDAADDAQINGVYDEKVALEEIMKSLKN